MANKLTKVFMAVLLVACMLVSAGAAMAATIYNVGAEAAFTAALGSAQNGDTIRLTDDVTLSSDLVISGRQLTIDLGGNTLTLQTAGHYFNQNANVLVTNGSIKVTGSAAGNGVFQIGYDTKATVWFFGVDVEVTASTAYGVFLVQYGSAFTFENSSLKATNDASDKGGAFKANNVTGGEKISIIGSKVEYANTGKYGCAFLMEPSTSFTVKDSIINVSNADNGFNLKGKSLFDNAQVTVTGNAGRGMTQYQSGAQTTIQNGSKFTLTGCGEGGLMYKVDPAKCPVIVNHSTLITDSIVDANSENISLEAILEMKGIVQINTKARVESGLNIIEPVPIVPQPAPAAPSVPQTGDNSALLLWAGLMVASALGMVWAGKKRSA